MERFYLISVLRLVALQMRHKMGPNKVMHSMWGITNWYKLRQDEHVVVMERMVHFATPDDFTKGNQVMVSIDISVYLVETYFIRH